MRRSPAATAAALLLAVFLGAPAAEPAPGAPPPPQPGAAGATSVAGASGEPARTAPGPSLHLRARALRGLPTSVAALIVSGDPGGEIVLSSLAVPLGPLEPAEPGRTGEGDGDGPRHHVVALVVEVDGPSLLGTETGGSDGETAEIQLFAYALTPEGGVAGFLGQSVTLDLDTLGEPVYAGGLKILARLELPPGRYQLRVLVQEPESRRHGLRLLPLEVPGEEPTLSAPLAAEPPAPWVRVAEPGAPAPGSGLAERFDGAGLPVPSALPVVGGEALELDALLHLPAGTAVPDRLRGRLRELDGAASLDVPAAVVESPEVGGPGVRRLRLRLPLESVPTGSYFLRLAARIDGADVTSPELGAIVLERSAAEGAVWTDVQRAIRGDPPRAELETRSRPRRARTARRELAESVATAYRTVLKRLATGDREGAVEDLVRIEREALDRSEEGGLELLLDSELRVQEALVTADPEALVPAARLHQQALRRTRERNRFALAAHSRRMLLAAVERYAQAGGDEAAPIASAFLAAVGDQLQQSNLFRSARTHLERAVALDPQNSFALLQLALGLERTGEYGRAVELLERLVAADPKAPEARLRLGVNLLRIGRDRRGVATLERLTREQNPDWVLAVAWEAVAMERLRAGDPQEAIEVLRRARARLPDQQRLAIQLAYTLERAGRRPEAHRLLDGLATDPDDGASPRGLYTLWPPGGREETEELLARAATLRLPALRRALAAGDGEAGA